MSAMRKVLSPEGRLLWPRLDVAAAYQNPKTPNVKGVPTYNGRVIHDPLDLAKFQEVVDDNLVDCDIQKVLVALAREEWGADFSVKDAVATGAIQWPIMNGDQLAEETKKKKADAVVDHLLGKKVIKYATGVDYPPTLSILINKQVLQINRLLDTDMQKAKQAFKSGNYARFEYVVKALETPQGKFLKFYVNGVRMTRPGDAIGGGGSLMSRMDGVKGKAVGGDPLEGLDDEIPF